MPSPYASLVERLARDPASPWLTHVDLVTGERTELSVASAVNGVAKAAHLLVSVADDLGRPPVVELRLPLHWQAVTLLLGCWGAGAVACLPGAGGRVEDADVVVLGPSEAAALPADLPEVVWASRLHAFGLPFETPPAFPMEDLAVLLRGQPDAPPPQRPSPVPLVVAGTVVEWAALLAEADSTAAAAGPAARLLTSLPLGAVAGVVGAAALPAGEARSVVLAPGAAAHPAAVHDLATTERVTATLGVDVPGLPRLG